MSFNVIVPTLGLALGLAAALLIVDVLGWRAVAPMFDRELLVTGSGHEPLGFEQREPVPSGSMEKRVKVPATLKVTHKVIGAEVRRGTFDVVVDGRRAGSVEKHGTFETAIEPGRHTLQIRNGRRNSSRPAAFDAVEGQVIAFRFSGKSFLPVFLVSFVVPSLAIPLRRERTGS